MEGKRTKEITGKRRTNTIHSLWAGMKEFSLDHQTNHFLLKKKKGNRVCVSEKRTGILFFSTTCSTCLGKQQIQHAERSVVAVWNKYRDSRNGAYEMWIYELTMRFDVEEKI